MGVLTSAAEAHAFVVVASPAPATIVGAAPAEVSIEFSEPVSEFGRGIEVFAPSGQRVSGVATASGRRLTSTLSGNSQGTYLVQWSVVAADTHPARGAFVFSVGHPSRPPVGEVPANELGDVAPIGLGLQAAARWVHFLGFALTFGVAACLALVDAPAASVRVRKATYAGIALLVVAEPLQVAAQAASLGALDAASAVQVLGSSLGRVTALRLGAALAIWAALPVLQAARNAQRGAAIAAFALVVAGADAASSHTVAGSAAWLAVPLTMAHLLAMSLWTGTVMVALAAGPEARSGRPRAKLSSVAVLSFATLAVTGLVLAGLHVRRLEALVATTYGLTILVKMALVGAAAIAGLAAHRRWQARHFEAAVLAGVLLVTAFLVSVPPIR